MKIAFMGSSIFSFIILKHIIENGFKIDCVYTRHPKPKGRGNKIEMTPTQIFALENTIPVYTPKTFKNIDAQNEFINQNFDIAIVASYGLILPKDVLDAPTYGCINIHSSILPRYRGASPIHHAIKNGDKETGITIMQMDEGLDTGDIIQIGKIPILHDTTFNELENNLAHLGGTMIVDTLNKITNNIKLVKYPQNQSMATVTKILKKEDGIINFNQNGIEIYNQVRAFINYPNTYFYYNNEYIKILSIKPIKTNHNIPCGTITSIKPLLIACNDGYIEILKLQKNGKKPMMANDFINGFKFTLNDVIL